MAKKKKKAPRSLVPYKLDWNDRAVISYTMCKVGDYRDHQFDPKVKIRTRLFYHGDDLPETLWVLPIPEDWDDLFSWNKQLITMQHTGRVGIAETSTIENYDANDDDDDFQDVYSCIFEDYNDLLLFKLALV